MEKILIIGGCGYIGSALKPFLESKAYLVDSCDDERVGVSGTSANLRKKYSELTSEFLAKYSTIILLAGHSSVAMAKRDPEGALLNNVLDFERLLTKLKTQKFIYASSSSVYTGSNSKLVDETWNEFNVGSMYDLSKYTGDGLALISSVQYYGLRFGTVCGHSPNLRTDVMINKMVKTAKMIGCIDVFNPSVNRPILGLLDLCRAVEVIINGADFRGLYNLASFNTTVGDVAKAVSREIKVPIKILGESPSYNFSMSVEKFKKQYNFEFVETVESIVSSLVNNWDESKQGDRV